MSENLVTIEQTQEFYEFLQGQIPDNDGCLAGFCDCCGCQHHEFVDKDGGCIECEETLYE
jgi:hypothetical protein